MAELNTPTIEEENPFRLHRMRLIMTDRSRTRNYTSLTDAIVDRAVIDLEVPLAKHLFQIAVAERLAQVLGNCLSNPPCLEMPAFELIP
ncbi:MAG: hypothetical protein RLZZ444_4263 [Pseudomonadota bacterium]